jgi:hypothetical protein
VNAADRDAALALLGEVPIELRHATRERAGAVVEVTRPLHRTCSRNLHINPANQLPSGIDRREFNRFKEEHWTRRAEALERGG